MTITAIILSHYKEREGNLRFIVDNLINGSIIPNNVIVIIDNEDIFYEDDRCVVLKSTGSFLPIIRFAIGAICDTDYCFFIDDDMTVKHRTLENFVKYAKENVILGLEGNQLADGDNPYTRGKSINRGYLSSCCKVDIIIRTYFTTPKICGQAIGLFSFYKDLPKENVDDLYLCLSNEHNYVIPVDKDSDIIELGECGVGQSYQGDHYKNRDLVCKELR